MLKSLCVALGLSLLAGCADDRPHDYGKERPPIGDLAEGDRGLQSKDVVDASDALAQDLLADPKLNASSTQWTLVVTGVENTTTDPRFNYDIFIQRLKVNLAKYGANRIALIENRDRLRDLRSREWEGNGAAPAVGAGIQPRYALYGRMSEMPSRKTSYYFCEFNLTDMNTRQIVWSRAYEVKARR